MCTEPSADPTPCLDTELLEEIAQGFAVTAGVNTCICDEQGRPLVSASPKVEFFRLISPADGSKDGQDTHTELTALLATGTGPRRRAWRAGLTQVGAPIRGEEGFVGLIVATEPPEASLTDEQIAELSVYLGIRQEDLARAARDIPVWTHAERSRLGTLLQLVADMLGHLCRQEARLRDRIEDLGAVHSVAGLVASSTNLQEILDTAARQIRRVMHVRASSIRLFEPGTGELIIRAVSNLSEQYLAKGPIKLERNPIDQAALSGETVYVEDMAADPRTLYPDEAKKEGIVSSLVAGMVFRGRPIGVIRAYADRVRTFSPFDASLLRTLAAQVASAIVNAQLFTEALDAERYARQLRYASDVQRRMIPETAPRSDRYELACVYHPSLALGGDFCDFISLPKGHIGVAVADVVGKGVAAALMMSSVRAALRAHAHGIYNIDEIMRQVNRHLCRDTLVSEFATLFYGVFAPEELVFTYCNAGHELPLLVRGTELIELESSGLAIGILPEEDYARHRLHVQPGDVLVLYTDGAFDATTFSGESFGRQRLRESIMRHKDAPAETMARNILMDIRRFIGLASQLDDITLVVARVKC